MHRKLIIFACISVALTGAAIPAFAGSLKNMERSTTAQGASFAGASSNAGDISYSSFNPASLRATGSYAFAAGVNFKSVTLDGTVISGPATGLGIDPGQSYLQGSGQIGIRINEDLVFGVSVESPFALNTNYPAGWIGAGDALNSELRTFTITPMISWDVGDTFTIAAGFNFLQIDQIQTSAIVNLDFNGTEYGAIIGLLWDVVPSTTIGMTYQTGYSVNLQGSAVGPATGGALVATTQSFNLADTLTAGITHRVNENLRIMGEVQWQNWSKHSNFFTSLGGGLTDPQNYSDTLFVAGGIEYDISPSLTVRAGAAWDEAPTDSGILPGTPPALGITNQTARVPNGDRLWLSGGLSFRINENATVDLAYSYIQDLENRIVGLRTAPGSLVSFDNGEQSVFVGLRIDL